MYISELPDTNLTAIADSVYLKYNPRSRRYHSDNYKGYYRGALLPFNTDFTDYEGSLNLVSKTL